MSPILQVSTLPHLSTSSIPQAHSAEDMRWVLDRLEHNLAPIAPHIQEADPIKPGQFAFSNESVDTDVCDGLASKVIRGDFLAFFTFRDEVLDQLCLPDIHRASDGPPDRARMGLLHQMLCAMERQGPYDDALKEAIEEVYATVLQVDHFMQRLPSAGLNPGIAPMKRKLTNCLKATSAVKGAYRHF
ncbi:hypothetical protein QFC21_003048 [Naganishia friedmannii]|uniref:Uncharacterized protein n=1 Tax=Naganishia friedmannii TaxID=89922 RepID=A0ACC2VQK3_9TREE|nr:hypothetical protein QFC21_003048 [Naganishia friedmannii]